MRRWGTASSLGVGFAALVGAGAIVQACTSFGVTGDPATDAGGDIVSDATTGDGGLVAETGSQGFCAAHLDAAACNDFDGVDLFGTWGQDISNGGLLAAEENLSRSPPRSLRATIADTGMDTTARLRRPISIAAKRVRLTFAFRRGPGSLAGTQQISIAEILCSSTTIPAEGVFIFLETPSFDVIAHQNIGGDETTFKLPSLAVGDWTQIVLDARLEGGAPTVSVTIGDALAKTVLLSPTCPTDPRFDMVVGLATYSNGASSAAFYDNILYEVDPP